MSGLSQMAGRLAALIGKLGSPHDGEVLGAARALGRLLEKQGMNFNDLAIALEAETVTRIVYRDREPEAEPADDWREVAEWCAARGELLSECEAEFVASMARILRRPGNRPTPKQAKWLGAIFDRLREDVAA